MTARRLGAFLLIGGGLLLGLSIILLALYGGIGHLTVPGLALTAALALLGAGGLVTSMAGSALLGSRATRIGVGILSVGLACMSGFSLLSGLINTDPLEVGPMVVLGGIGYLAIPAGVLLVAASLAWRGLTRRAKA